MVSAMIQTSFRMVKVYDIIIGSNYAWAEIPLK
jgi:hypothetical protein